MEQEAEREAKLAQLGFVERVKGVKWVQSVVVPFDLCFVCANERGQIVFVEKALDCIHAVQKHTTKHINGIDVKNEGSRQPPPLTRLYAICN